MTPLGAPRVPPARYEEREWSGRASQRVLDRGAMFGEQEFVDASVVDVSHAAR